MGVWRAIGVTLVVASMGLGSFSPREADAHPKTIRARLDAEGLTKTQRRRVEGAIRRGTAFLLAQQAKEGGFREAWSLENLPPGEGPITTSLLCALALHPVGTPEANDASAHAARWAFEQPPTEWGSPVHNVQSASLALLLGEVLPRPRVRVKLLAAALAEGINEASGYWAPRLDFRGVETDVRRWVGLVDSSYAALGLWCAHRRGIEGLEPAWIRHTKALQVEQTKTGSWHEHPQVTRELRGVRTAPGTEHGTTIGRVMGLLALHMGDPILADVSKGRRDRRRARARASTTLGPDLTRWFVEDADPLQGRARPGGGTWRDLWFLQLAMTLGGVEEYERSTPDPKRPETMVVEERSWLLDGLELVLGGQRDDGGWSPHGGANAGDASVRETAYALLFLTLSAQTLKLDTPPSMPLPPAPEEKESGEVPAEAKD